jgi:tRNA-dihydrouridine synthase 1
MNVINQPLPTITNKNIISLTKIFKTMTNPKLGGFDLFKKLQCPTHFVAPMVEQSELAWRILSRKYGAHITYTPMFHAKLFATQEKYRKDQLVTHCADQPLVVQFCANDPEWFVVAAKLVQDQCVAVDLNLGCPQGIAKRGHYGSFLQDEWDLVKSIVTKAHEELSVPIFCKIRILESIEKSVEYAKMLEGAGCQLLTVHGRLREQKGQATGLADWEHIKAIKKALSIPVIANGNILYFEDIQKCIHQTLVDGVMSAEGNLYNPGIFQPKLYACWKFAQEYLDICHSIPNSAHHGQAKSHIFKIFHKWYD